MAVLTTTDLSITLGTKGFAINGAAASDNSGISVSSAGDVNNDGFADIIIGANTASPSSRSAAGASYVIYGSATNPGTIDLSIALTSSQGFVINGAVAGDHSRASVSNAGDVNNDGFADIIIGANAASPSSRSQAGASYVIYGSGAMTPTSQPSNIVTNPSAESGNLNGWSYLNTPSWSTTTATAHSGVRSFYTGCATLCNPLSQILYLVPASNYTISLFVRGSPSTLNSFSLEINDISLISSTITLSGFQQFSSSFTALNSTAILKISGIATSLIIWLNDIEINGLVAPSTQPSLMPSVQPSIAPTNIPSNIPTMAPSSAPSTQPSSMPSERPSSAPSAQPSSEPTEIPSSNPSTQPSEQPITQPSEQPSIYPSSQPSAEPSDQPTMQPSDRPSDQPTGQPSIQPTAQPTTQPSDYPSVQPSEQPSHQPSSQPSSYPSSQPTTHPSNQPSA